jgi:membrane protease subunit (stomatin/prohibitin family)
MPFRRRRPLLRAAAVGGVAYTAGKAGANAAGEEADPNAPAEQPESEQAAPPVADPAQAAPSADASMEELTKLKGLLDSGVLTQAEFDVQKQKILQSM